MGDPEGIGPEITRKALFACLSEFNICHPERSEGSQQEQPHFIVIGNKKILGRLPFSVSVVDIPYKTAGEGSLKFLDRAISLIKEGVADALVTAPLSKERVSQYAKNFVGHTEYLAQAFTVKNFDMMFVAGNSCLTIVTRHVPLKEVPKLITQKAVYDSIALMAITLKK